MDYTRVRDFKQNTMAKVCLRLLVLITLSLVIPGIQGQMITPSSVVTATGDDVFLTCATNVTSPTFVWIDVTGDLTIYRGGIKVYPFAPYTNFDLSENTTEKESTLIINDILLIHERQYRCDVVGQPQGEPVGVIVEVGPTPLPIFLESVDSDTMYQATCSSHGSKPEETIKWILDGVVQTQNITEVYLVPPINGQIYKDSVFMFPATLENYNVRLECNISGHQVTKLNRQESRLVDIHNPPVSGAIDIDFSLDEPNLNVSCDTLKTLVPRLSVFYIYSNDTQIYISSDAVSTVTIPEPTYVTEFTCIGANYLGETTTIELYDPDNSSAISITGSILTCGLFTSIVFAASAIYDII